MTTTSDLSALSGSSSSGASSGLASALSKTMNSDDFMTLFLAELKNQNPLEPMNNQDMMNQMVSLNTLNQMSKLNDTLESFGKSSEVLSAAGLIGKQVQAVSPTDNTLYDGVVKSLSISGSAIQLQLEDGSDISLDWLTGVEAASAGTSTEA
jgi:flagellar basal-body rod modification protein FlgD